MVLNAFVSLLGQKRNSSICECNTIRRFETQHELNFESFWNSLYCKLIHLNLALDSCIQDFCRIDRTEACFDGPSIRDVQANVGHGTKTGISNYEDLLTQVYPMWIDRQKDRSRRCHETSNLWFCTKKQCKACRRWQKTCKLHQVTNCRNTELSHHVSECPMGMGHAPSCIRWSKFIMLRCFICVAFWETLEVPGPGCRAVLWLCTADADHTWVGQSLKTWIKLNKSEFGFKLNIFGVDSEWISWTWTIVTIVTDWGPSPTRLNPQQGRNRHLGRWVFLCGAVFPGAWPEWRAASKSGLVGSPSFDVRSMEWGMMEVHWNSWKWKISH